MEALDTQSGPSNPLGDTSNIQGEEVQNRSHHLKRRGKVRTYTMCMYIQPHVTIYLLNVYT